VVGVDLTGACRLATFGNAGSRDSPVSAVRGPRSAASFRRVRASSALMRSRLLQHLTPVLGAQLGGVVRSVSS